MAQDHCLVKKLGRFHTNKTHDAFSFLFSEIHYYFLIKKTNPSEVNPNLIGFIFTDKKTNKVKILFDKNSLELKGWETIDAYSNKVNFEINNLIINNQIMDDFFKIPQEKDL